jgi:HAE1 family hydrophobic/amphiphilic exporter-1
MGEEHCDSHKAASEAMSEVTGAVVATSLVLIAVFVPVAFFPGTTGLLYQQFSLTIAFSIAISAFNSLTFTPSLSALLLKPESESKNIFFRGIENVIKHTTTLYTASVHRAIKVRYLVLVVFFLGLAATYFVFKRVPTGFVPDEDQGYFIVNVQAPQGASLQYTSLAMRQVEAVLGKLPDVEGTFAVMGFSFTGSPQTHQAAEGRCAFCQHDSQWRSSTVSRDHRCPGISIPAAANCRHRELRRVHI